MHVSDNTYRKYIPSIFRFLLRLQRIHWITGTKMHNSILLKYIDSCLRTIRQSHIQCCWPFKIISCIHTRRIIRTVQFAKGTTEINARLHFANATSQMGFNFYRCQRILVNVIINTNITMWYDNTIMQIRTVFESLVIRYIDSVKEKTGSMQTTAYVVLFQT